VFGTCGCSDAKVLDEQAAAEITASTLVGALSGANLIHDVGFLDSALLGSHEMVVLSDEIIGMVKRFLGGIRVDDDTLALEVIDQVGPGGNFLAHEHTAEHLRREIWFPRLMDRTKFDAWQAAGSRSMGDRVRDRVAQILAEHRPPPLPEAVAAGIEAILARADQRAAAGHTDLL
jgi:trimethylamine--corrinoid protein Co-methyltransferase